MQLLKNDKIFSNLEQNSPTFPDQINSLNFQVTGNPELVNYHPA